MKQFRIHVVALPHTQTTFEYEPCAYTGKVRKFADMMTSLGHEVFLYGSEEADCKVTELVTCITKEEIQDTVGVFGPEDILKAPFDRTADHWTIMNGRVIEEMGKRITDNRDLVCLISGFTQQDIVNAFPNNRHVEFGIGYAGVYAKFRVWESYAWMHVIYGAIKPRPNSAQGDFYDRVIPNYFETEQFPAGDPEGYYLFIGRNNEDKGLAIAIQTVEELGGRLIVAGQKNYPLPDWVEYRGLVGPKERGDLMSHAIAVFTPTLYLEPFAGVHVEAMLCGTPIISTDWGVFTETVEQGKTGFRCRTFKQFVEAAQQAPNLDRAYIRERAQRLWSVDTVKFQYQEYFEALDDLWESGWYTGRGALVQAPPRPTVSGDPMAQEGML